MASNGIMTRRSFHRIWIAGKNRYWNGLLLGLLFFYLDTWYRLRHTVKLAWMCYNWKWSMLGKGSRMSQCWFKYAPGWYYTWCWSSFGCSPDTKKLKLFIYLKQFWISFRRIVASDFNYTSLYLALCDICYEIWKYKCIWHVTNLNFYISSATKSLY